LRTMLKQAQLILNAYRGRTTAAVAVIGVMATGTVAAYYETTPVGITLVLFEWLASMFGIYAAVILQAQLASYLSPFVPGFRQKQVATAIGLTAFVAGGCVALSAVAGKGDMWASASSTRMFALFWAWSLIWFSLGRLINTWAFLFPLAAHLSVTPLLADRVEPYLWLLVQGPSRFEDFLLVAVVGGLAVLLASVIARPVRERPIRESSRGSSRIRKAPKSVERMAQSVEPGVLSRIRHLELGLKRDYWIVSLIVVIAFMLWWRYRLGNPGAPLPQPFEPVYFWCFMATFFMLGQEVFTRDRLRSLLQLPVSRHDLIREYGLTLFLCCTKRWLGLLVVAWAALTTPLPGLQSVSLPSSGWGYCIGILLIVFSLRALAGSWNDRALFPSGAIVLYMSLEIPTAPVIAILIGIGLMWAAYYRWLTVELD
jgi:hypothetical protein